jgi:periplasmic divalent cation tolerance protein
MKRPAFSGICNKFATIGGRVRHKTALYQGLRRYGVYLRLAACGQMFPIESVYLWKEKICEDKETVLFIKSKTVLFDNIAAVIKENHSYEIPEIVQVPMTGGLPEYLQWIDASTGV